MRFAPLPRFPASAVVLAPVAFLLAALGALFLPVHAEGAPATPPAAERAPATPLRAFVRGTIDVAEAHARGLGLGATAAGWTVVRGARARGADLRFLPGVTAVAAAGRMRLALDSAAVDSRVATIRAWGLNGFEGPAGAGIIIGIVDTGVDLDHEDFRRPDGTTRIVSLWDQASSAGPPPAGFTYGTEYEAAAIDAGIVTSPDEIGHGTHVAGIAAGNGHGGTPGLDRDRYVGVAPEATLCVVKLDFGPSGGVSAADVVDGVAYVFARATALGMPAVVNLSLGGHQGPHDGTDPVDEMISAMTGPGRIVVAAAGNEGSVRVHGTAAVPPGGQADLTFRLPGYTPKSGAANDSVRLSAWIDPGEPVGVTLTTPSGTAMGPLSSGVASVSTGDGHVTLCVGACTASSWPFTEVSILVADSLAASPPATGLWTLRLARTAGGETCAVDAYVADQDLGEWAPWVVWEQGGVTTGTLRSPATGDSILSVAAHVTKACWIGEDALTHCGGSVASVGGRAFFSSRGPRRDGSRGLDLSAPGASVVSSRSTAAAFTPFEIVQGGAHVAMQGTSMAAPHVAGAVALLLKQEGWHDATPSRVRARLAAAARADAKTGAVPNIDWGVGKLDVVDALDLTPTAVVTAPPAGERLRLEPAAPNPFNPWTAVRIVLPRDGTVRVRVHGPGGALVRTLVNGPRAAGTHRVPWDGRDDAGRPVASGVYYLVATAGRETVTRKATLLK